MALRKILNPIIVTIDTRIVFRLNPETYEYDESEYDSKMTDNLLSKEDLRYFMIQLYKKTNNFELLRQNSKRFPVSALAFWGLLAVIGAICSILSLYIHPFNYVQFVTGGALFISSLLIMTCSYNIHTSSIERTRKKTANLLREFLEAENCEYKKKGLRWHLNKNNIEWLELWLDYKESGGAYEPPNLEK